MSKSKLEKYNLGYEYNILIKDERKKLFKRKVK
jgi:hypothetical protein